MKIYYDDLNQLTVEGIDLQKKIYFQNESYDLESSNTLTITELDLSKRHIAYDDLGGVHIIIPRFIVKTEEFNHKYNAYDERLGSYVDGEHTIFNLWAPSAIQVDLVLESNKYTMTRQDNGVFTYQFNKSLHGDKYSYLIYHPHKTEVSIDPYCFAASPNLYESVVCDFSQLNLDVRDYQVKTNEKKILEVQVRDTSSDEEYAFKHRGQFLSLLEEPAFSYFKNHSVDYLQIMPIHAFASVDDLDIWSKYNWGYDPMHYFVLKNSYSSVVNNPFQVMQDFAHVVDKLHENEIGVSIDVVYNHIYDVESSSLNKTVPYYYFRYEDNELSNGSFCGNEIASEMLMCRKMIVESLLYLKEVYKVKAFRFDLMGLMDNLCMETIESKLGDDVFLYGEGWNMPSVLENEHRVVIPHSQKHPNVGFFNDKSRDELCGAIDGTSIGILRDDLSSNGIVSSLLGDDKYLSKVSQSIHYVECHDNLSLADRMKIQNFSDKESLYLSQLAILLQGNVLLQAGQSFFRDKQGGHNTYNLPDSINAIQWKQLNNYEVMHEKIVKTLQFKENRGSLLHHKFYNENILEITYENGKTLINHEDFEIKLL